MQHQHFIPHFSGQMLTAVVQVVDDQVPDDLEWKAVDNNTQCFEAVAKTECAAGKGTLYTINVITGVLLKDGLPPGRLPPTIIDDSLYQRAFGVRNFEVSLTGGKFTSNKKLNGYRYHFFRDASDNLIVREVHGDVVLELMDTNTIEGWGPDIPIRLQKMYSHWCYRNPITGEVETILFRGKHYCDRAVSFLLHRKSDADEWVCACVPEHKKAQSWHEKLVHELDNFDHLVLLNDCESCQIITVLLKFEPRRDCIHVIERVPRTNVRRDFRC